MNKHQQHAAIAAIPFDNSYARELAAHCVPCQPALPPAPRLVKLNSALAEELGLPLVALQGEYGAQVFSGQQIPSCAEPVAQAYAGHQFGGYSPQLGDGRALLLGEVMDVHGQRRDIAFKGSGRTPFSRRGDGKAALGPVLREYLLGEAMHALGIPTTRALAAVTTGETIQRDRPLPGAVLTRVAASHLRVGTFEYFANGDDEDALKQLADYAIRRHDPALQDAANPYLAFLDHVSQRQASLIAQWMHAGFIHGVMNTDNMTISGETIDYGPCAFMDAYDPATVFSSIDERGRYAYGNQPAIAQWNLARLAEALLPLLDAESQKQAVAQATEVIHRFVVHYRSRWLALVRQKLGLHTAQDDDQQLADDWLALMHKQQADFTLAWRYLADVLDGDGARLTAQFADSASLQGWLVRWQQRLAAEPLPAAERAAAMRSVNPLYIARNHLVEEALAAASEHGDLSLFERLLAVLQAPFAEQKGLERYTLPAAPEVAADYRTFCGT